MRTIRKRIYGNAGERCAAHPWIQWAGIRCRAQEASATPPLTSEEQL
jgi:hypothetical protein